MSLEQFNPLVTVYIPTYNRVDLLRRAVESVRQQTYYNLEIIIVDDCSTDATHEYLEEISKLDKRIRYFLKEKNSGACVSRNIAIENAKGEFITGLDDDDYFTSERISNFLQKWLKKDHNTIALFTLYTFKLNEKTLRSSIFSRLFLKTEVKYEDILIFNMVGNQIFTKTNFLKEINGFDPDMPAWQDLDCWYRLLVKKGNFALVKNFSYVVDLSHPYERISTQKIYKIQNAYNLFIEKNGLSKQEEEVLYVQLFSYSKNLVSMTQLVSRLFKCWDLYSLKFILQKLNKS